MKTIVEKLKVVMVAVVFLFAGFASASALAAGRAETMWPVVCDDAVTFAEIVKVVKTSESTYGKCVMAESSAGFFGRPETKFRQSMAVIFRCSKIGAIKFSAGSEVDVKKSTCELKSIKQTKLPGQYCGLTEDSSEDWKEVKERSLDFSKMNDAKIAALPSVTKQQLVLAAKEIDSKVTTAVEAVALLKDSSESEDLYYNVFEYDGVTYNEVLIYPGGNASGLIFKDGSLSVHAFNGDGSIECSLK